MMTVDGWRVSEYKNMLEVVVVAMMTIGAPSGCAA